MKASTTASAANQVANAAATATAASQEPQENNIQAAEPAQPKILVYKRSRNGGFYVYLEGVMPEQNIGCNCRTALKAMHYMFWKKRELGASISEKHLAELKQLAGAEG